jgi:hypothetical protein
MQAIKSPEKGAGKHKHAAVHKRQAESQGITGTEEAGEEGDECDVDVICVCKCIVCMYVRAK